jgi:hypothetical protein
MNAVKKGTVLAQPTEKPGPPPPLQELTWDELLTRREALLQVIENLEAEKSAMSAEFLARLQDEKLSGKVVGNWSITKAARISFDVTIEQARELGAVKETIDQPTLKKMYQSGVNVPGIKRTEYITVRQVDANKE